MPSNRWLSRPADPLSDDDVVALEFAHVYVDFQCPSADTHLAFGEGLRRISVLIAWWESKQRKLTDSDKLIAAYELALVLAAKIRDAAQLQSFASAFIRLAWQHLQESDFHCHMLVLNGQYFEIELDREWSYQSLAVKTATFDTPCCQRSTRYRLQGGPKAR